MRRFFGIILGLMLSVWSYGQAPTGFGYQAVLRNAEGNTIVNQNVSLRISLTNSDGTIIHYMETHTVTTNALGIFSIVIGQGEDVTGSISNTPWSISQISLKLEIKTAGASDFTTIGSQPLQAVPYAMYAANDNTMEWLGSFGDPPLSPELNQAYHNTSDSTSYIWNGSQWQVLTQKGSKGEKGDPGENGVLVNGTIGQTLVHDGTEWVGSNAITVKSDTVTIGVGSPVSKLIVQGIPTALPEDPIFEVKNKDGKVVLGVYNEGVRVYVADTGTKGAKGGFAVGGLSTQGKGEVEYFRITPDSARIYIDTSDAKGAKGGFAVGGLSTQGKVLPVDLFRVTKDSTRVYIADNVAKGAKGGFAVGGLSTQGKASSYELLRVTRDSTRIYVDTSASKGAKGGFAVGGLSTQGKASSPQFLNLTPKNYFIGHEAAKSLTTGKYNSTLGYQSGLSLSNGESNSFVGYQSGYKTNSGKGNLFLGYQTGFSNQSGNYNSFLGYQAGYSNTTGLFNTFIGSFSGYLNQSTSNNTFVGDSTGYKNKGSSNSFFGTKTGLNNTTGSENVFIGNSSGYKNSTGSNNVFIGNFAGYMSNSFYNVLIGHEAGYTNTGTSNVLIGFRAGKNNGAGGSNVFVGKESGLSNTFGSMNVFLGEFAGQSNTEGDGNVFIGKDCAIMNTTGDQNVNIGYLSGAESTSGWLNVSIGFRSGRKNNGMANVIIGNDAAYSDSTGFRNVYVGTSAGYSNKSGFRNVFIGSQAGYYSKGSNKLYIESTDADSLSALIYGEFDNDFVRINNKLAVGRMPTTNNFEVNGNASKTVAGDWLANSDRRIKTDIKDIDNALETLLRLRPVKFKYTPYWKSKHSAIEDKYYYNFIAQEFQQVFPESVKGSGEYIEGDNQEILQIDTYNAQVVSIKAIQELAAQNQNLIKEIEALKAELNAIKELLKK